MQNGNNNKTFVLSEYTFVCGRTFIVSIYCQEKKKSTEQQQKTFCETFLASFCSSKSQNSPLKKIK